MSNGPIASLDLQESEAHVVEAASRLYAAQIAAGNVTNDNAEEVIEACARHAIALAIRVDRLLQTEGEHTGEGSWNRRV